MRAASVLLLGALTGCASPVSRGSPASAPATVAPRLETASARSPALGVWDFLMRKYDADGDGLIASEEYRRGPQAFAHLDADGDGLVSPADFAPEWTGRPRARDFTYGEGGPEPGDPAPGFRLASTTGETFELASFHGRRPVALVFGSFT